MKDETAVELTAAEVLQLRIAARMMLEEFAHMRQRTPRPLQTAYNKLLDINVTMGSGTAAKRHKNTPTTKLYQGATGSKG